MHKETQIRVQNSNSSLKTIPPEDGRTLTRHEFYEIHDIPPEVEWLANITNPNTRKGYQKDALQFFQFLGIAYGQELKFVTSAHVIAWRKELEQRKLKAATIRRKLSTISDLFKFLINKRALEFNPVLGVDRPKEGANEGKTPPLSDEQVRRLFDAPDTDTKKGLRDKTMLYTLAYTGMREAELVGLQVKDYMLWRGLPRLRITKGKGGKMRYVEAKPVLVEQIEAYLDFWNIRYEKEAPLFQQAKGTWNKPLSTQAIRQTIEHYGRKAGITLEVEDFCVHSLRATFATNAHENGADLQDIKETLGHSNVSTTQMYVYPRTALEKKPEMLVRY